MKNFASVLAVSTALLLIPACVDYGYGYGGGYSGYYDNYYGPIYDGYWGGDVFFYRTTPHGAFTRDDGRHFRRGHASGYTHFRYARPHDMPQPPPHHRGNH